MTNEIQATELQRARWRRARGALRLADPLAAEFGDGGLGRFVPDIRFRVLVLPGDPGRHVIDFGEDIQTWWMQQRQNPFDQRPSDWGPAYRVSLDAAIRYSNGRSEPWSWDDYLALHRCAGIEFGSGRQAAYPAAPNISAFRLIYMVGRLWSALELYREVIERFSLHGPWELSVALRNTRGSYLGHVASGWREPSSDWIRSELLSCPEPHVLIIREVTEWPSVQGLRELVFSLAMNLDNAWGFPGRRFLAREGALAGEFDVEKYR